MINTTKERTEIPKFIPQIGFLEGDFGEAFFMEFSGRVKSDYNNAYLLNVLRFDNNIVIGGNPFALVLANQILREENLRIPTQADLEKALRTGRDLKGTYEETGLVLRSEKDSYSKNTPLAKYIAEQVKERGIRFSPENPVMIPLTGLELEKADDNGYGLTFRLREDAEIYEAPVLSKQGKFDSKDIDKKTGLPNKVKDSGSRALYVRDAGLSRLSLYCDLSLLSHGMILDVSGGYGRIVVISDEATTSKK